MNVPLAIAGCLAILLGLAHSAMGERIVLRRLMAWDGCGADGEKLLSEQMRRVLRASWHLVTVFGFGFAAALLLASSRNGFAGSGIVLAGTFLGAAVYWLIATRGRHPAWIILIAIGLLTGWGQA